MATYGLTATGFVAKTLEIIRDDLNEALTNFFGTSIDLENGLLAKIIGILSERYAELWELAEAVNSSQNPDAATAVALDALCLLTGTFRLEAISSTVTLTLTGSPTTVVAAGSRASTLSTGQKFLTTAPATILALSAWTITTGYTVGQRVRNASRAYQCITSGTSAGSGGPTTTAADITDGTVHWRYLGEGTGAVDVASQAMTTGPVIAISGDITVIETPIGGWSSVINILDAVVGYDTQTDEALRITREEELSQAGTSTADAIRAALLAITGVTSATVFVNDTDVTDPDGMPPHSVEALVLGGADATIGSTLLAQVAAGVQTIGNTTTNPTDSEGVSHTIKFSRPTQISIYADLFLTKDTTYPTDGDAQVKAAIVAFGAAQKCGKNAVASSVAAQAFKVTGVLEVTDTRIYTDVIAAGAAWLPTTAYVATPGSRSVVTNNGNAYICITGGTSAGSVGPLGTGTDITDNSVHWRYLGNTIPVAPRELAVFDTSRVDVTSSTGTP